MRPFTREERRLVIRAKRDLGTVLSEIECALDESDHGDPEAAWKYLSIARGELLLDIAEASRDLPEGPG